MKETLGVKVVEMKQEMMPDVKQMVKSEWQCLYSETRLDQKTAMFWKDSNNFKQLIEAIDGKSQLIFMAKLGKTSLFADCPWPVGDNLVFGVYCHEEINTGLKDAWKSDHDFQLKGSANNFAFCYSVDDVGNEDLFHFDIVNKQSLFGYIYTDYAGSGALSIMNEFMLISWAEDFEHRIGLADNLNCLESTKFSKAMGFKPNLESFEVWQYVPGKTFKIAAA